jgi:uncharacterized protein
MPLSLPGFALAALIGLSLGMLGGGGSILTVPVFVYVLGFGAKQAIAMSLPVVGATSLVGAASHWRAGNLRPRTAIAFGLVTMAGSFLGARLSARIAGEVQLAILSLVILTAAALMYRGASRGGYRPAEGSSTASLPLLGAAALGVGMLTGLVGIGGGFLIVPALVLLARVPMKEAVGTSLLVIAMNSLSGYLGYAGRTEVAWDVVIAFGAVAIAGILVGTWLVRFVSAPALRRGFAIFLVLIGVFVLYQNRGVFAP